MDYIKIRFSKEFERVQEKGESSIEDIFRSINPMFSLEQRTWKPSVDIYETADDIIIRAEVAGVDKDRLEVEICSRALKIFGVRRELPRSGNATYRLAEIQYGNFERTLYLPTTIDTDNVSTSYVNGFLEIRLIKKRFDKTYKIPVSEGKSI
ncbi:MAG: Hsp20/alpha crystallin family protein [Deltaproteobacteria bacterium]|nr:Hsp20/alpha crystallin family protein [Deltaproteobacteria bacterium]